MCKGEKTSYLAVRNLMKMEKFEVSSVVRGYHIYKETWTPFLTEHLECKWEEGNDKDRYAVAVLRHDSVVGYIVRRISAACCLFTAIAPFSPKT